MMCLQHYRKRNRMSGKMHHFIPPIPSKLAKRLLPSSDIAINSIAISIDSLNRFMQLLPTQYGWRFRTVDAHLIQTFAPVLDE
jgi:hypothetical protein